MELTLVKTKEETKDTKSFFFESDEKITWQAGQYIFLTLPKLKYVDERGETRHLTISSAPTEKIIKVTTRLREGSGFKKTLNEMELGSVINGRGPFGTFLFEKRNILKESVFLAGGIGITPFRSIIKDYRDGKNLENKPNFHLIYSNSDNDFVFKEELDNWQKESKNLKIYYHNSKTLGHLDEKIIENKVKDWNLDLKNVVFYTVGPDNFVNAMEDIFEKLQIQEENIKTEKFTGY